MVVESFATAGEYSFTHWSKANTVPFSAEGISLSVFFFLSNMQTYVLLSLPSCALPAAEAEYVQWSSSPLMRRPREELSLNLEYVNVGGVALLSLSAMELGTPRGNDTTTGSYSGLLGATLTCMDVLLGLEVDAVVSILRFSPTLALFTDSSSLSEDDDDELDEALPELRLILSTVLAI